MANIFEQLNLDVAAPLNPKTVTDDRNALRNNQVYNGLVLYDTTGEGGVFVYTGTTGTNEAASWIAVGSGTGGSLTLQEEGTLVGNEAVEVINVVGPNTETTQVDDSNEATLTVNTAELIATQVAFDALAAAGSLVEGRYYEIDNAPADADVIPAESLPIIAVDMGGTGATTAEDARTNLGISQDFLPSGTLFEAPISATNQVDYITELANVPTTFAPSAHTHVAADITDFNDAVDTRITTIGDVESYADMVAFTADTTTIWHHGDVAIFLDTNIAYLYTGTEGMVSPDITNDFHQITSTETLVSLGITSTAADINTLTSGAPYLPLTGGTINGGGSVPLNVDSTQDFLIGLNRNGTFEWFLNAYTDGRFALHENGVGDQFTILAGGNVGVGTITPDSKLHVRGDNVKIEGDAIADPVSLSFNQGNAASINSDVNYANIVSTVTDGNTGFESSELSFQTRLSGTTAERMRIHSTGDISTAANSHTPYIQLVDSGRTAASPGYTFNNDVNTGMFQPSGSDDTIAFSTAGVERMRIDSDGDSTFTGEINVTDGTNTLNLTPTTQLGDIFPTVTSTTGAAGIILEGNVNLIDNALAGGIYALNNDTQIGRITVIHHSVGLTTNRFFYVQEDGTTQTNFFLPPFSTLTLRWTGTGYIFLETSQMPGTSTAPGDVFPTTLVFLDGTANQFTVGQKNRIRTNTNTGNFTIGVADSVGDGADVSGETGTDGQVTVIQNQSGETKTLIYKSGTGQPQLLPLLDDSFTQFKSNGSGWVIIGRSVRQGGNVILDTGNSLTFGDGTTLASAADLGRFIDGLTEDAGTIDIAPTVLTHVTSPFRVTGTIDLNVPAETIQLPADGTPVGVIVAASTSFNGAGDSFIFMDVTVSANDLISFPAIPAVRPKVVRSSTLFNSGFDVRFNPSVLEATLPTGTGVSIAPTTLLAITAADIPNGSTQAGTGQTGNTTFELTGDFTSLITDGDMIYPNIEGSAAGLLHVTLVSYDAVRNITTVTLGDPLISGVRGALGITEFRKLSTTGIADFPAAQVAIIERDITEFHSQNIELDVTTVSPGLAAGSLRLRGLKTGTLASPPAGLVPDETWLDTTDSTTQPIMRINL